VLRDVYYFKSSQGNTTGVAVGLVRRGTEAHEPADGMRINRERVLAIERVGLGSAVARAIQAQRQVLHTAPGSIALNRTTVASPAALAVQRIAAEHAIGRAGTAAAEQLRKFNELVLPVTKAEADAIMEKAVVDLRTVRRNALAALGTQLGMSAAEADVYARTTDPMLEGQSFANETGVLLAPDLDAIVASAAQLYAQVGDAAAKQLTEPKATPKPSASPSPSPRP
jgi:hypothetical protein